TNGATNGSTSGDIDDADEGHALPLFGPSNQRDLLIKR
ncbi:membrane protein, partial [Mycobacterium marinum]